MLKPIEINFTTFEPIIKEKQTEAHYKGHYLKYINNLNNFLKKDKTLKEIYCQTQKMVENNKFRKTLLLSIVNLFDQKSDIVHNAAQIYNHELYWSSMTSQSQSLDSFCNNKKVLFNLENDYINFYDKYLELGTKHFGSGWLWFIYNNGKLDIVTTHDAIIPLNQNILGCY